MAVFAMPHWVASPSTPAHQSLMCSPLEQGTLFVFLFATANGRDRHAKYPSVEGPPKGKERMRGGGTCTSVNRGNGLCDYDGGVSDAISL